MTNPGAYEQYPRPSVPAGPSSWQQPAFLEGIEPATPARRATRPVALVRAPSPSKRAAMSAPPRDYSSVLRWARVTAAASLSTFALALGGTASEQTSIIGIAIVMGMGAVGAGIVTLRRVFAVFAKRPGPQEDNG